MFWCIMLTVFCLGLIFFFYLRKGKKQIVPDYSYIIFKDYSSDYSKPMIAKNSSTDMGEKGGPISKGEGKIENISQKQDNSLSATLNFED